MTYSASLPSRFARMILGLPFIVGGLAVGLGYGQLVWQWYQLREWVEVPCIVTAAHDKTARPAQKTAARSQELKLSDIRYGYHFEGRPYTGEEVALALDDDADGAYEKMIHSKLSAILNEGGEFRCYVNPAKPGESLLFREPRAVELLPLSLFPVAFTLVGSAFFVSGLMIRRQKRALHSLQSQFPGEPWRWKPEWAGDAISPQNIPYPKLATVVTGWIFIVWGPLLYLLLTDVESLRMVPFNGIGMLPAIPLLAAVALTVRSWWRHAGKWPLVKVQPLPLLTGGPLNASIQLPASQGLFKPASGLKIRLSCHKEREELDQDGDTKKRRELRWHAEQEVSISQMEPAGAAKTASLKFEIPGGLPAEDLVPIGTEEFDWLKWVWELEISGTGLRHAWVYSMPVFAPDKPLNFQSPEGQAKTRARKEKAEAENEVFESWTLQHVDIRELKNTLAAQHIEATIEERSKMPQRFLLPSARFSKGRGLPVFFMLVWTGITLALVRDSVPLFVPALFGALALLLLWLLGVLYRTGEMVLDEHGLKIGWRLGPWQHTERLQVQEIKRFWVTRGYLDLGSTRYRKVHAEMRDDRRVKVLDGLRDPRTAESLVTLLEHWRKQTT